MDDVRLGALGRTLDCTVFGVDAVSLYTVFVHFNYNSYKGVIGVHSQKKGKLLRRLRGDMLRFP